MGGIYSGMSFVDFLCLDSEFGWLFRFFRIIGPVLFPNVVVSSTSLQQIQSQKIE